MFFSDDIRYKFKHSIDLDIADKNTESRISVIFRDVPFKT